MDKNIVEHFPIMYGAIDKRIGFYFINKITLLNKVTADRYGKHFIIQFSQEGTLLLHIYLHTTLTYNCTHKK
jgi:hypothetical protein